MITYPPVLLKDVYKVGHVFQYPDDLEYIYSNGTFRCSRIPGINSVVWFGLQAFIQEVLVEQFDAWFALPTEQVVREYKRVTDMMLGPDSITVDHIAALHQLGYLPLRIKSLPEGTLVPIGIPAFTIVNTHPEFGWLTNMVETILSESVWLPATSATIAHQYRLVFEKYADITGASKEFIPFQAHDFSMRGMGGLDAATSSGGAHLTSFVGTDTIPAVLWLEKYYDAGLDGKMIGCSVPATEHSVMCMGSQDGERETYRKLITETYPAGIISIVSDTWDYWNNIVNTIPSLHKEIMARDGKVVLRPDSGDPADIICGTTGAFLAGSPEMCGSVAELWKTFGGTVNRDTGYATLDPHIGLIYGDSITLDRQVDILERLRAKGLASDNIVLGVGSFTYQYNTRDTFGFAIKATWGKTTSGGAQEIFKAPKTDDGTKNSAKGLLCVSKHPTGRLVLEQCVTPEREKEGELKTVFLNGRTRNRTTLTEVRARLGWSM